MEKSRLERILQVIQKHRGQRVYGSDSRAEFDFSIVYELLNLEDYIQELEDKITKQEVDITSLKIGNEILKKKCKIKK